MVRYLMKKWYVLLALVFVVTVGVRMMSAQTLNFSGEGVRYKAIVEKLDPALDACPCPGSPVEACQAATMGDAKGERSVEDLNERRAEWPDPDHERLEAPRSPPTHQQPQS